MALLILSLALACQDPPPPPAAPLLEEGVLLSADKPVAVPVVQPPDPVDLVQAAPTADAQGGSDTALSADLAAIATPPPPAEARVEAYLARRAKSVVELQQWRDTVTMDAGGEGAGRLTATLVDLNPVVHEWLLLQLAAPTGEPRTYHLEVTDPHRTRVYLDPAFPDGLSLVVDGEPRRCALWPASGSTLELARSSGRTFAPLCDGLVSLRNPAEGRRSTKEWTTDFLRDNVWGGEKITTFVRDTVYADSELVTSEVLEATRTESLNGRDGFPLPAQVDPAFAGKQVVPANLGLSLAGAASGTLEIGRWYAVESMPGVYVSAMQPRFVSKELTAGWVAQGRTLALDEVESSALVFQVAFDLDQHELAFDQGTDHTRVGWSERVPPSMKDARMPGPDGFSTLSPLVRTGRVNPVHLPRLIATFTGGFKRSHGAFKSRTLGYQDFGTHYGFAEHGVLESRLWPGLATAVVWADGQVEVRTWTEQDEALLWRVRHARQNGVPIVEPGPDGRPQPGALVTRWTDGNWSGSVDGKQRSVRASLCVQDSDRGRFLLYGYFSSATPSAMAHVLAAYGCGTGMVTDMNALEHTYLSLHRLRRDGYSVEHLIRGMEVLDKTIDGTYLSRFVGLSDNRDFFTVLRKER